MGEVMTHAVSSTGLFHTLASRTHTTCGLAVGVVDAELGELRFTDGAWLTDHPHALCLRCARHASIVEHAQRLGADDGRAMASWLTDDRTDHAALLRLIEDGDPQLWDMYRSPLSGEYADDYTPDALLAEVGASDVDNDARDDIFQAYEEACYGAWIARLEQTARYHVAVVDIPADFPVKPLPAGTRGAHVATCGTCGLSWDDSRSTTYTPVPAGRCPFEHFHPPTD